MRNAIPSPSQIRMLPRVERRGDRACLPGRRIQPGWRGTWTLAVCLFLSLLTLGRPPAVSAGPVILGGDDLTDHGSITPTGELQSGWVYIRKALENLHPNVTLPGNDGSVAALGSEPSTATAFDAGAAIGAAAAAAGLPVSYYNGATAIGQFLSDLASGATTPAIIWLAGTHAQNDLDGTEGAVLTANAPVLANFVNAGGGLMAHGFGPTAYGWLEALFPGLEEIDGCESVGAALTPAGQAAFPGLSNSDIDSTARPCHSHFVGDLGTLDVFALDGNGLNFIIGSQNATLPTMLLTPPLAVSLPGATHTVTATVTDPIPPFAPQPGIEVTFTVTAGPNIGKTGMGTTDANGQASFTYTGDTGIGRDTIIASIDDPQAGARLSNPVTMSWTVRCDIDGDQVVDLDDLQAIFNGRNTTAPPDDLRDADTDGTVTVNDGRTCALQCARPQCTQATPPVAQAGPSQTVNAGDVVTLDGSGSSDAENDPLTFAWAFASQPTGSSATLSDPTAVNPTFTADVAGTYVMQLIVNDGATNSDPDTVTVEALIPVGFAPATQTVAVGATLQVDIFIPGLEGVSPEIVVAGYNLDVVYDPAILQATSVTFHPDLVTALEQADISQPGIVDLSAVSLESDARLQFLQADQVTLATITFTAVGAGTSNLEFGPDPFFGRDVKSLNAQPIPLGITMGSVTVTP